MHSQTAALSNFERALEEGVARAVAAQHGAELRAFLRRPSIIARSVYGSTPAGFCFPPKKSNAGMLADARQLRDAELARGRSGHWTASDARLGTLNAAVEALETIVAQEAA
jgi:hypothetical protein